MRIESTCVPCLQRMASKAGDASALRPNCSFNVENCQVLKPSEPNSDAVNPQRHTVVRRFSLLCATT